MCTSQCGGIWVRARDRDRPKSTSQVSTTLRPGSFTPAPLCGSPPSTSRRWAAERSALASALSNPPTPRYPFHAGSAAREDFGPENRISSGQPRLWSMWNGRLPPEAPIDCRRPGAGHARHAPSSAKPRAAALPGSESVVADRLGRGRSSSWSRRSCGTDERGGSVVRRRDTSNTSVGSEYRLVAILFATLLPMAAVLQSRAQGEVDVPVPHAVPWTEVGTPVLDIVTASNEESRWQGPLVLAAEAEGERRRPLGSLASDSSAASPLLAVFLQP
jgi:hypothetical protein